MALPNTGGGYERRAPASDSVLLAVAALDAAHRILETTREDATRELAKAIVRDLQQLRIVFKGDPDV